MNFQQARSKRRISPAAIGCFILLFLAFLCFFSARWFVRVYGRIGFDSILYTLTSSMGGVEPELLASFALRALLPTIAATFLISFLLTLPSRGSKRKGKYGAAASTPARGSLVWTGYVLSLVLIVTAAFDSGFASYVVDQFTDTSLYETYYTDPSTVRITFPEKKRNLVYIMLESMETSYLSEDLGGAMDENLIPELYDLAKNNVCFSDTNAPVGGFHTTSGATWTIGSMVAQTAGIPLKTPTEDVNKYGSSGEAFLPGVTTLTDILNDAGYTQMLMVGSDASFGGRKAYYEQHGITEVLDLYSARAGGYIPKNYFVWWGMEDQKLFNYAQQTILNLAENAEPFAFTMLTVDTHHVGGYQCELCQPSVSGETYDQSISCSSRQVAEFVKWLQAQPFYENTTVIIVGDHESMDNGYFSRNVDKRYQRMMYNCFLNPAASAKRLHNRQFTAMDLFPTTLAAMGCTIEGNRLGLGTDLFSGQITLCEKYGFKKLNDELAKASDYYKENFWQ